jgi:hypothetical protein
MLAAAAVVVNMAQAMVQAVQAEVAQGAIRVLREQPTPAVAAEVAR